MVGQNKILTVSYGTFSCTLEGFDEPFGTMKAIAEYFRDLAADDRYFGAEPPTPDAEMLHRIAEREIKRRVEARVQDNGIILRPELGLAAAPTSGAAQDLAPRPDMAAAPAPQAPEPAAEISDKLARIRAAMAQPPAVLPAAQAATSLAAPRMPQIEDSLASGPDADGIDETDIETDTDDSILGALLAQEDLAEDPAPAQAALPELATAQDKLDDYLPDVAAPEPAAFFDEDDFPDQDTRPAATAPDIFDEFADEGDTDTPDDGPADPAEIARQRAAILDSLSELNDDADDQDQPRPAPIAQADADEWDDVDDADDHDQSRPVPLAQEQADDLADDFDAQDDVWDEADAPAAAQAQPGPDGDLLDDDFDDELGQALVAAQEAAAEQVKIDSLRSQIRSVLGETGLARDAEESLISELAQIEKDIVIKHPNFLKTRANALAENADLAADRLAAKASDQMQDTSSRRRREAFEHLSLAVAATRAEVEATGPRRADIAHAREIERYREDLDVPDPRELVASRGQAKAPVEADAPLDTQSPAVAAKADMPAPAPQAPLVATHPHEDPLSDDAAEDELALAPYAPPAPKAAAPAARMPEPVARPQPEPVMDTPPAPKRVFPKSALEDEFDLHDEGRDPKPAGLEPAASLMDQLSPRPRRPVSLGPARTERTGRPVMRAPLVLVSEQRVDDPSPLSRVRPRRVNSAAATEAQSSPKSEEPISAQDVAAFKKFADDVDAWLLDEQIEAAAAYLTHAKARPTFNRADLIGYVMAYNVGKTLTREDMVRAFETVLREERLERDAATSEFRLSSSSEYDEPARAYRRG